MYLNEITSKQYVIAESMYGASIVDASRNEEDYGTIKAIDTVTFDAVAHHSEISLPVLEALIYGGIDNARGQSKIYRFEFDDGILYIPEWWD